MWTKILLLLISIIIFVYITSYKEEFYVFDTSLSDKIRRPSDRQPNPQNAPKEDCWIYYVPQQYHEACRTGYFDKTSTYLMTRKMLLEKKKTRNASEQRDLNSINLTLQARAGKIRIPGNGYGCKLGLPNAKSQVKMDWTDQATIASRNNELSNGAPTQNTSSWAYCFGSAPTQDIARQYASITSTPDKIITANADNLYTFRDSEDTYYRINFQRLDYESVKNATCAIKRQTITQTDTQIFIGFSIATKNKSFRISNYDVYVLRNNKLQTLAQYNNKANPLDVFTLMFEIKVKNKGVYICPKRTTVNVGMIDVDPICDIVKGPPKLKFTTIDIGKELGIPDIKLMDIPDNVNLTNGLEGLDEQYNKLAAEYLSAQGKLPKRRGVELRRYDLKPGVEYNQRNAYSTQGLDTIFRDFTENMVMYYRSSPTINDWQQNKAWEINCYINVPTNGTYGFKINSDDASEFFINNQLVSTHYGYHGTDMNSTSTELNFRAPGLVKVKARFFQLGGPEGLYLLWRRPNEREWTHIPDDAYYYEHNNIINEMNTLSQIRDSISRQFYETIADHLPNIKDKTPNFNFVSNYISAYDRIYISYGNPDNVLKPPMSPTQQQILEAKVLDVMSMSKLVKPPDGIDYTQPATYTVALWIRVENKGNNAWRNIIHYGTQDADRTPGIWLFPSDLTIHVRHRVRDSNGNVVPNYGVNYNLATSGVRYRRWFHLAVTVDRNIMKIYVNGKHVADSDSNGDSGGTGNITSASASGYYFVWNNSNVRKKFSIGLAPYINTKTQSSGPYYIQKLVWYNVAIDQSIITKLSNELIANLPSTSTNINSVSFNVVVPPPVASSLNELGRIASKTGEMFLRIRNNVHKVYVEVRSDVNPATGKVVVSKWLLILNYLHKGGTNPQLFVRQESDGFPILKSSTLGVDGSQDRESWGHLGNSFMRSLQDTDERTMRVRRSVRFYGNGGSSRRILNMSFCATNNINFMLYYAIYGRTSPLNINCITVWPRNTAAMSTLKSIRQLVSFNKSGDYALTEFPFFNPGKYHWGIRGEGFRWEVDDYYRHTNNQSGYAYNTHHQVWLQLS